MSTTPTQVRSSKQDLITEERQENPQGEKSPQQKRTWNLRERKGRKEPVLSASRRVSKPMAPKSKRTLTKGPKNEVPPRASNFDFDIRISDNDPIYFWKPEQEHGYLGQWYPSRFVSTAEIEGERKEFVYQNAEQYMMHRKGLLFAPDSPITHQILNSPNITPATIKSLGRQIPNFVQSTWELHRYDIVKQGNYLKFTQSPDLKGMLVGTGDTELVEASPMDRIWGVGFGKGNAGGRRGEWGLNLLGNAIMEVRARLREEVDEKGNSQNNLGKQVEVEGTEKADDQVRAEIGSREEAEVLEST